MMTYLHDHKILLLDKNFSVSILEFLATTGYYPGACITYANTFQAPMDRRSVASANNKNTLNQDRSITLQGLSRSGSPEFLFDIE